ncbi:MAG: tannase/feruloyl esterase family alpha/beta hydrolase [Bryobacterales bacterium]|nr:tannase/feruloyl esterase family alpha/beta hydrolase [Bryobacterales bacterium]
MKYRILLLLTAALPCIGQSIASKCAGLNSLTGLPNSTTLINSSMLNAPRGPQGNTPALPEHCEVQGRMNERIGVNSQRYAIRFHLRLPTDWNGRFLFEGGGGSNGNLGSALGNLQGQQRTNALAMGFAVVSTDSGHDNAVNNDPNRNGTVTFGFDPQARRDFGYNSYDQVTQAAKAIIRVYYGRAPERSYYVGCSEGGREAMMMSQRFPTYFDGILACAPGLKLAKAALFGHAADAQALGEAAKASGIYDRFGQPLLNKTFTDEDLDLAAQAIMTACDALDGLEDGVIDNFPGCTSAVVAPKFAGLTCKGAKRNTCLSGAQVAALQRLFAGARSAQGELLYADWAWDRGIGGKIGETYNQGWRSWKLGAFDAANNSSIIATLGSASASALFVTPPVTIPASGAGPMAYLLGIDFERDAGKLYAKSGEFTEAVWDFMMASATDLSAFKNRRGKLLIVHGVSDPVFSINDTISWWNDVNRANNGAASDFTRLFAVPGMNHCGGGPATDQFDAFTALVNWVEKSTAPDRIVATAGQNSPWPGRTRPLCAYPKQARYKGSGSIEDASNFVCQ